MKSKLTPPKCDCGSGMEYANCCGCFIDSSALPANAEQLMRSRYTAFVRLEKDHLLRTWHPDTRPQTLELDEGTRWLGLKIKSFVETGSDTAEVEFVARSKQGGAPAHRLHERSRFILLDGKWLYLDGEIRPQSTKIRDG